MNKIVGNANDDTLPYRWYLTEYIDEYGYLKCDRVLARSWPEAEDLAESNGEVVIGILLEELDMDGKPLGGDFES